jgi:hypothetical protein
VVLFAGANIPVVLKPAGLSGYYRAFQRLAAVGLTP